MGIFSFFKQDKKQDDKEKIISDIEMIIKLENAQEECNLCEVGDYVGLWNHPEKMEVRAYRRSTVAGEGYLGNIPKKHADKFYELIKQEGRIQSKILEVLNCNVLVHFYLEPIEIQREKDKVFHEEKKIRISKELTKPKKLTKPISLRFDLEGKQKIKKGTKFTLKIQPIEIYLKDPENLFIIAESEDGFSVQTNLSQSNLLKIVRSYYGGFEHEVELDSFSDYMIYILISPKD